MEDDLTENNDSLNVATKCWKRVMDVAMKMGYREGVQDGTDSVLQNGFDIGYKDGFETAFILGKYKSLSVASSSAVKHPTDVAAILSKTKRGTCWICSMESENSGRSTYENVPFTEVLNNQKEHSTQVINRLYEYFQPNLRRILTSMAYTALSDQSNNHEK